MSEENYDYDFEYEFYERPEKDEDHYDNIKICGLWKTQDKQGNLFLSGPIDENNKFHIVPNKFKKNDMEPDYFFRIKGDCSLKIASSFFNECTTIKKNGEPSLRAYVKLKNQIELQNMNER